MRTARAAVFVMRLAAGARAISWLARAARRRPPLAVAPTVQASISVVIPAREEAARIGPLLEVVVGAPGVAEVVVVDDESTDATAQVASGAGARVVPGRPLPLGWVGKAWALQQGIEAASGEWVVTLDADTRPSRQLPTALVARCVADGLNLATVAGRFECPTAPLRWLHPAMLTTLLYRAAPPGALAAGPVHRRMGNGQCMAIHRPTILDAGGLRAVGHHAVEDVALVRAMATAGFDVGFLDGAALLNVRMYEDARHAWFGWGRSLALPGVDSAVRRVIDLAVVAIAEVWPPLRLVVRRADALDLVLIAVRLGTLAGTARAYRPRGCAYWLSPLADPLALPVLIAAIVRPRREWRGRRMPSRSAAR